MTRKEMTEQFDLFDSLLAAPEKLFTDDIERNVFRFISSCRTDNGKSLGDKVIKYLETIPCFSMCYCLGAAWVELKLFFHHSNTDHMNTTTSVSIVILLCILICCGKHIQFMMTLLSVINLCLNINRNWKRIRLILFTNSFWIHHFGHVYLRYEQRFIRIKNH